jgi:UDP-N-acetylmuramyl pentapeptide synthase
MPKIPFRTKLLIWLAGKLLEKVRKTYTKKYNKNWPIVLVAGTAGKSSTTLLIQNLFSKAGWQVFGSATKTTCLNSLTGLIMVLGRFFFQFEGGGGGWHKFEFLVEAFWASLFGNYSDLQENSVLVFEVGFNEQYEANFFTKIFEGKADFLVVTNLTLEHSFGFSSRLDSQTLSKLENNLPSQLVQLLLDSETNNGRLGNTALEQLTNSWHSNISGNWETKNYLATRSQNRLEVNNQYLFPAEYLLPLTFAKTVGIIEEIKNVFNLEANLQEVLDTFSFPNGRFSLLAGVNDTVLVDSTYNSDPASLVGFLNLFQEILELQKATVEAHLVLPKHNLILGEMREMGKIATVQHNLILDKILEIGTKFPDRIESIRLIGSEWLACNQDDIIKQDGEVNFITYSKHLFKVYKSAGAIIRSLPEVTISQGNWYWLKGSQNTIFLEGVTEYLLENKEEAQTKLCRRGAEWDQMRAKWLV